MRFAKTPQSRRCADRGNAHAAAERRPVDRNGYTSARRRPLFSPKADFRSDVSWGPLRITSGGPTAHFVRFGSPLKTAFAAAQRQFGCRPQAGIPFLINR